MKVAIVDRYLIDLKTLADEICKHYFYPKEEDVWVYQFDYNAEFMDYLYEGLDFRIVYLDETTCDFITFKTVQELLPHCAIVLLTKRDDYIPLNNYDILTKPYDGQRVYDSLVYHIKRTKIRPNYIKVNNRGQIGYVDIDDIVYIESNYGKVYVHTKDDEHVARELSYRYYHKLLDPHGFISISQSFLVNVDHITSSDSHHYILSNGTKLKASTRRKVNAFKKYIEFKEAIPWG